MKHGKRLTCEPFTWILHIFAPAALESDSEQQVEHAGLNMINMGMIWECPLKCVTPQSPPKSLVFWSISRAEHKKQLANLVAPDSILIRRHHRTIHLPITFQSQRNQMKDGVVPLRILRQVAACSLKNTATRSEHCYGVPWSLCFMCEIVDVESSLDSLDLFERTTIVTIECFCHQEHMVIDFFSNNSLMEFQMNHQ